MFVVGLVVCCMSVVSGVLCGLFCMMGVCFDCFVEIDGVLNV